MARPPDDTRLPWRKLVLISASATILCVLGTLYNLSATKDDLGTLVDTKDDQPAAAVIRAELGPDAMKPGGYHDGAYFYAIALDPFHPSAVASNLDRPRYRLQRILYPLVSRALHPTGGGPGLMWAMFAVGVASIFVGAVSLGGISASLGGSVNAAWLYPFLFGSILSLRLSVADAPAVALGLLAFLLYFRGHDRWAIAAAVAACLTKEPVVLMFAGLFLWRRERTTFAMAAIPAAAVLAWAAYLRIAIDAPPEIAEFTMPGQGVYVAIRYFWGQGYELFGMLNVLVGVVVAVVALAKRRLRHPLAWTVVLQLAFLAVLTAPVLGPERNGSRQVMIMTALGVVMLVTPDPVIRRREAGRSRVLGSKGPATTFGRAALESEEKSDA